MTGKKWYKSRLKQLYKNKFVLFNILLTFHMLKADFCSHYSSHLNEYEKIRTCSFILWPFLYWHWVSYWPEPRRVASHIEEHDHPKVTSLGGKLRNRCLELFPPFNLLVVFSPWPNVTGSRGHRNASCSPFRSTTQAEGKVSRMEGRSGGAKRKCLAQVRTTKNSFQEEVRCEG